MPSLYIFWMHLIYLHIFVRVALLAQSCDCHDANEIIPRYMQTMGLYQTVENSKQHEPRTCIMSYISFTHYNDVIIGWMASQITSLTIVYLTVCSGADKIKHQSSASLAFVRGIHRSPVNSPHKGTVTRKMFPFYDVIMLVFCPHWHSVSSTVASWRLLLPATLLSLIAKQGVHNVPFTASLWGNPVVRFYGMHITSYISILFKHEKSIQ